MGGIVLLAAFTQGVIGFGFGMVTMSVLPRVQDIYFAVALIAVFSAVVNFGMLLKYRKGIDRGAALPLVLGAFIGVPLGVLVLKGVDPRITLRVLGAVVASYAVFQLVRRERTRPERDARSTQRLDPWALPVGVAAGALGGAFNTGGPPVIIYGTLRTWPQETFKGTINALFASISLVQVPLLTHAGLISADVLKAAALGAPLLLTGLILGAHLSQRLDGITFRRIVLWALIVLGLSYGVA